VSPSPPSLGRGNADSDTAAEHITTALERLALLPTRLTSSQPTAPTPTSPTGQWNPAPTRRDNRAAGLRALTKDRG
jgi:hypothetical protein